MKKTWNLRNVGDFIIAAAAWVLRRIRRKGCRPTPPLTEQQQLLKQLRQQREKNALAQYRQDCAVMFAGMSGGIQALLAQESRPCSRDSVFCRRLVISAENESLRSRLTCQIPRQNIKPLSPETEAADPEALREMIRIEKSLCPDSVVELPWEELIAKLATCLEGLIRSAEDCQAEDCRIALTELRQLLAEYSIYPIWYHEDVVRKNEEMQWDYIFAATYPVPALYYHVDEQYIHVGAPGCTGEEAENE